jgi:hypothetical protein
MNDKFLFEVISKWKKKYYVFPLWMFVSNWWTFEMIFQFHDTSSWHAFMNSWIHDFMNYQGTWKSGDAIWKQTIITLKLLFTIIMYPNPWISFQSWIFVKIWTWGCNNLMKVETIDKLIWLLTLYWQFLVLTWSYFNMTRKLCMS